MNSQSLVIPNWQPKSEGYLTNSLERVTFLRALSQGNQSAINLELAKCKKSYWRFLTNWVTTEDQSDIDQPYKLFPDKPHLYAIAAFWLNERFLLIPKSRQMSVSWLMCGLHLWEA